MHRLIKYSLPSIVASNSGLEPTLASFQTATRQIRFMHGCLKCHFFQNPTHLYY